VSSVNGQQFGHRIPKQSRVGSEIPETDTDIAGQSLDDSLVVGATGNEMLLKVQVEGEPQQFLIDSGASLSLVKPGVNPAIIKPTDLAARGDHGNEIKKFGNPRNRNWTRETRICT